MYRVRRPLEHLPAAYLLHVPIQPGFERLERLGVAELSLPQDHLAQGRAAAVAQRDRYLGLVRHSRLALLDLP